MKQKTSPTTYMDLLKAFDTLDHNILLAKLRYWGINETPIRWIEGYLTNRPHYDLASKKQKITRPPLFLIYLNDMINVSQAFKFILYADDTTLFTAI